MISTIQAVILGLLQGITELFPVSSLGHSVILPHLLGWSIDQNNPYFLIFLVATHFATSLVLLGFFWADWVLIVKGLGRSLKNRIIDPRDTYAKLGWLIVVGSIPAGILGLLFEDKLKTLFALPRYAAAFLIINGIMLWAVEHFTKKVSTQNQNVAEKSESALSEDASIAKLSWFQSVKVGCAQAIALLPGFSRTGATLAGGLTVGLEHEGAARFSFLLAAPIIFAASVLKFPELLQSQSSLPLTPIIVGALTAAIAAYFSVKFLTKYFQTKTLRPFAYYCIIAGAFASIAFFFY